MTIADQIISALNSQRAVDNGLSNGDAKLAKPDTVTFTFPAPVVSGACNGSITIAPDGSLFDDTMDNAHASVDAFVRDLESMMEV